MKEVKFLDLRILDMNEKKSLINAISNVLDHGRIVLGPEVEVFEKKIADFCGRKYAVSVGSGTDALFLCLKALGIGPGDEVITTALSWIATANAIALTGATPIFADINEDLNISPKSIESLITSNTKAIMPVHYTGRICDMRAIKEIANQYNLLLIEDASQAFSARLEGHVAGSFGDMACFSLNPMKILAACGEAGVILCDNEERYNKLLALRYNGTVNKEVCIESSLNGRMDTIQAAVLLARLEGVEQVVAKRREIAAYYAEHLKNVVCIPNEKNKEHNVYYTYTIRADRRDELMRFMSESKIETKIHHPYLMSEQPVYKKTQDPYLPVATNVIKEILSIPCHEKLSMDHVKYVSDTIIKFYEHH